MTEGNVEQEVTGMFQKQTAETVKETVLRIVTGLPLANSSQSSVSENSAQLSRIITEQSIFMYTYPGQNLVN